MAQRGNFLLALKDNCISKTNQSASVARPPRKIRNNSYTTGEEKYKRNWFCNRPLSPVPNTNTSLGISTTKNTKFKNGPVVILQDLLLTLGPRTATDQITVTSETSLKIAEGEGNKKICDGVQTKSPVDGASIQCLPGTSTPISSEIFCDVVEIKGPLISTSNSGSRTPSPFDDSDADPEFIPSSGEDSDDSPGHPVTIDRVAVSPEIPSLAPIICSELEDFQAHGYTLKTSNYNPANQKTKRERQKDFCYFCESLVLNFARHIKRNHSQETEVQRIFAKPVSDKDRKELITLLRKKGNYLENSKKCTKPMKKPVNPNLTNFLPCTYCLGFYSAKQLWRHRKKCTQNSGATQTQVQTDAQNYLLKGLRVDQQIREEVFPRMRADQISLVAKQDTLICAFGARYMKLHREKHFINVTSRKMRELSRILIELRKLNPNIKSLFDGLQPQYFDLIVCATKIAAKYDHEKEVFVSPTYAMNIAASLKQCCDIAIVYALKRKEVYSNVRSAEAESNLKTMIRLLEANWKFDISTQAADDLNKKKWNKISMVPLASDLKLLKEFLIKKATTALQRLEENNNDQVAYTQLLESVFCRVLLLNRRRPGELERLPLRIYNMSESVADGNQKYEEFAEVVSPTEKILMNTLKRIVITGKRNRGVPVLFSLDVQLHIKTLLQYRDNFIKKENPFLFGRPNFDTPIRGYKVLQKNVQASGAKNPAAITSTKLRKHLATLTQLFNMSENDIEQLSTFMGHTPGVHRKSYRLPDDVYQTAKISKLLLLMEKGGAAEFKGKALEDIDIDLNEDLWKGNNDNNEPEVLNDFSADSDLVYTTDLEQSSSASKEVFNETNKRPKGVGSKRTLVPWTSVQKKLVESFFKTHIKKKQPPKKRECETLIEKHPEIFANKSWLKMKVYVQNKYTKT